MRAALGVSILWLTVVAMGLVMMARPRDDDVCAVPDAGEPDVACVCPPATAASPAPKPLAFIAERLRCPDVTDCSSASVQVQDVLSIEEGAYSWMTRARVCAGGTCGEWSAPEQLEDERPVEEDDASEVVEVEDERALQSVAPAGDFVWVTHSPWTLHVSPRWVEP